MKKSYFYILGGLGVVFIGGFFFLRNRTKQLQQQATATALQDLAPSVTQPQTVIPKVDPNLGKAKEIEAELKKNYKVIEDWKKTKKISQMSLITILSSRNKKLLADLDGIGYKWDNSTQTISKK
jgi:ABC-type Fe3+-citrate transport system substrate-binding protein